MGGCATKPKDSDCRPDSLPSENPSPESTVKRVEGEAAATEIANGGESHKEEPLVDLSEPNPEAPNSGEVVYTESKTAIADLISEVGEPSDEDHVTAKQTEENVGAEQREVADLVGKADTEMPESDVAGNEQLLNSQSSTEKGESPLVAA